MAEPVRRDERWTLDAFVAWLDDGHGGDDRWELVDGAPRMMTRPTLRHQTVSLNIATALRKRLRGGPCTAFLEAMIETSADQARVPDVTVDCGHPDLSTRFADEPTVVVEVLSPSTRDYDEYDKHAEFRAVPSVRHIVFVDPDHVGAAVWTRGEEGWTRAEAHELDATLALPAIGCDLPLAEVYEDAGLGG